MWVADAPVAVLIPERGRPDELAHTLAALAAACAGIEPAPRVRVLVNGAPRADYAALQGAHAGVEWHFTRRALGYHGAVVRLVADSAEPWVYLLNSDMRLHVDALRALLPWRADDVFAIASQLDFVDRFRRREETGYTLPVRNAQGRLELHDAIPPDDCVRGHVYAGGGASLYQRAALQRYLKRSRAYAPFYFEDADWGVQAWAEGLSVLYCPASRADHVHRATIGRYHAPERVARIVARNLEHFRWRYGDLFGAPRGECPGLLRRLHPEHARARRHALASPAAGSYAHLHLQRHPHARRWREGLPRVLVVSPFAVLPPAHGGARRIVELARASAEALDCVLLHDEGGTRPLPAQVDDGCFRAIHPVGGRPADDGSLAVRWQVHAHPTLRAELARLLQTLRPDVIAFEHLECIGLIESLPPGTPCVWTLHDAGRELPPAAQVRVRAALARVDALVLTTPQDRGFWAHARECVIENGVRLPDTPPAPSAAAAPLLLLAPLRYAANRAGLADFLAQTWPALAQRYPALRLRVLAGIGGGAHWGAPLPERVELVDGHVDPAPHYAQSLLALNPQGAIEGSAIKLAEALAHARTIVSTASGARGYEALATPALRRVADVAAMAGVIGELIDDASARHAAEAQARTAIAPWSWTLRAQPWIELLRSLRR
ncbi:MAG: glycosyltransferase [Xanthomonadales bacterium]|nr:hypothetical protein [Xanthomonadales bacterium]MCC6593636.1 glycosyltransferase [Xanthomonadales bacterium]